MNHNDRASATPEADRYWGKRIDEAFDKGYLAGTQDERERLLAERETTVPDAERVERAAKALFEEDMKGFEDDASLPWDLVRPRWMRMARAALAAAGPEADWLDAALDSVHPLARVVDMNYGHGSKKFDVQIEWPVGDADGNSATADGTGTTRTAAIKDAIATALAAKQEGGER